MQHLHMPTPVSGYPQGGPSRPATPVPDMRRLYGLQGQASAPPKRSSSPGHAAFAYQLPQFRPEAPAPPAPPARKPIDPSELVQGQQLDYWSDHNQCWMPAIITDVDNESGGICLNVKPDAFISRSDQRRKVRSRTIPNAQQVATAQGIVQQEQVEPVAEQIFVSAARAKDRRIPAEQVPHLGAYLDGLLGLVGSQVHLMQSARSESGLGLDEFKKVFWELLQLQQEISVQAIPRFSIDSFKEGEPWQKYAKGKELGHGTYGFVYLASDKHSKQVRAIKEISKEKLHGDMQAMKKEIENLTNLDHPHILKLYEVYSTKDDVYLVTDFCPGGELHGHISSAKKTRQEIPMAWIAEAMQQLMQAICHIHVRGIIHLDVKSQNIMLMPSQKTAAFFGKGDAKDAKSATFNSKPHVVVIDLGIAMHFKPGDYRGNRPMGTPMTMAPEVWSGEITPEADVFSCGCVFFELLCGEMPFRVKFEGNFDDVVKFWRQKPRPAWQYVSGSSRDVKELLEGMLLQERQRRPSASQCLASKFLKDASAPKQTGSLNESNRQRLIKRLASVHCRSVLYKNIAMKIAQDWPPNQMPTFKQLFNEFDVHGNGSLPTDGLKTTLMKHGVDEAEASRAAAAMNLSQDKDAINWTEFVAACIDLSQPEFEPKIFKIFQDADADRDNLLSASDLMNTFPQGNKYGLETATSVFRDLTGRDAQKDRGARMDWSTFYKHLQSCALNGVEEPVLAKTQWDVFIGGVTDAINNVTGAYFSNDTRTQKSPNAVRFPGERIPQSMDDMLKTLADMGFKDRELNRQVLNEKGGSLSDDVIETIMQRSSSA
mmetsp:Transcript_22793/g.53697  ORF Transcript_22793/g.53697 Transcript_22793/m.53697 type:complete len:825 (+) Transcript_22793:69-2543(+)